MSAGVVVGGLDGSNPLGFLASLGALRVLDERARALGLPAPRLAFRELGRWRPVLYGLESLDEVIDAVMEDLPTWEHDPALALAYTRRGTAIDAQAKGAIRDLKPPPAVMRAFLDEVAGLAAQGTSRPAQTAAAYATDVAVDHAGHIKPTALHFTAGQQTFLKMVAELQRGLDRSHLTEALVGPWTGESTLPSLSWDASVARSYALRATDPSKEKRGSVPGAEWLAFQGLAFLPSAPRGKRILTPGVRGRWKDATFAWPLWSVPAAARTIRSLLATDGLRELAPAARAARGIGAVVTCAITRSDQGGYGAFSPGRIT